MRLSAVADLLTSQSRVSAQLRQHDLATPLANRAQGTPQLSDTCTSHHYSTCTCTRRCYSNKVLRRRWSWRMWGLWALWPLSFAAFCRLFFVDGFRWRRGYYHIHQAVDELQRDDDAARWRALDSVCNVRFRAANAQAADAAAHPALNHT